MRHTFYMHLTKLATELVIKHYPVSNMTVILARQRSQWTQLLSYRQAGQQARITATLVNPYQVRIVLDDFFPEGSLLTSDYLSWRDEVTSY